MAAASWSELPRDLLRLIANCLDTYTDEVRFACVCTSWRSILLTIGRSHPWCLLSPEETNEKYDKYNRLYEKYEHFYCLYEKKFHYLEVSNRFRGSSHGWLVSTDEDSPRIYLFSPFTKVQISLPPRYMFPDVRKFCEENELEPYDDGCIGTAFCVHRGFLEKVILSSSPSKANCMVAAICGRKCNYLAYCKLGDESWTCIVKGMMGYDDATFDHEQKLLYAVTFTNHVHVFDLFGSPKLIDTIEPPLSQIEGKLLNRYLVKTSMGLLQVQRHLSLQCEWEDQTYDCYQTSFFNLYMFEPSSLSWCKVGNIGENVLFLGQNSSISIASSCLHGYKGNQIYFIDRLLVFDMVRVRGERYDIGVYNLDSTSVQSLQRSDIKRYRSPTPIWYIHSPEDFFEQ
ncbi:hypothetical protein CQW23_02128 [Capsicum baccatum]|uniref:F-box domain-containing protein n=1 Tax=Capsicum baccatum TaxID=33114 RepID=A0A2G2XQI9_CAPBA|nr:hypothetical protein CQW23_02128 [Capsicum baccatum]